MDNLPAPRASLGTAAQARYAGLPTAFAAKHPRLVRGQRAALPTAFTCYQFFKNSSFGQPTAALRAAPMALPDVGRYAPPAPQGCAPCGLPATGPPPRPTSRRQGEATKRPPRAFKSPAQAYPYPAIQNAPQPGTIAPGGPPPSMSSRKQGPTRRRCVGGAAQGGRGAARPAAPGAP